MNQTLARTFVSCLSMSGPPPDHEARLASFGEREWEQALAWLDLSGLALYFWRRVREAEAQHLLPRSFCSRLERSQTLNCQRVADMGKEFSQLNRLFEDSGVRYVVLKGFAMTPDCCPDATLRTQYDYDFLVHPASLGRAEEALRNAGYVLKHRKEQHPREYLQTARPPVLPSCRDDLYSPHLYRAVELHVSLWGKDQEKIHFAVPADTFERAGWREWRGVRFPALADEDALLFQVLHMLRHVLNNWCRLSIFLELAHFLHRRSSDSVFWARFREHVQHDRALVHATAVVFSLATRLFDLESPEAVSSLTTASLPPVLTLWVQRYGLDSALENFRGNKFSLFLHREFVQDARAWREIRRQRLFPLQRPHRTIQPSGCRAFARLRLGWKERVHDFRRFAFHLSCALRYAWELPKWQRLVRHHSPARVDWGSRSGAPLKSAMSD